MTEAEIAEARQLVARLTVLLGKASTTPQAVPPASSWVRPAALTPTNYAEAATRLACDVATIRAVTEVESNGSGFGVDGRPIILFEPHVFSRLTQHRFDDTHGGVSYVKWGARPYPKTQAERWGQLEYAAKLDADAALQSASYGLFQIMGFNFAACHFADVKTFVAAMRVSEREHLMAFVAFVKTNNIDVALRERRWAEFAARYNGSGYKKNAYDTKLAAAYAKHLGA